MQVRTYSRTFWKRYRELGDDQGEKYIKQIERGEQRIQRQQDIMNAIAAKMDRYRNPWQVSINHACPFLRFMLLAVHLIRAVVTTQWGSVRCPTAAGSIGSQSPLLLSLDNTSVCVLLLLLLLPK